MIINPVELKNFVENNPKLVTRKESKRYPGLFVLKYKNVVFYDNLWHVNPLLNECRGLVVDADYNVIVKPFTKVFNYQENGTKIDRDEMCRWVRKVNGFLGVVTYHPNYPELIYSTTGSLDSDFVDLVAKHIDPIKDCIKASCEGEHTTFMFEICDETDPHIINEKYGPWLIGMVIYFQGNPVQLMEKDGMSACLDMLAVDFGCLRPESGNAHFSEIVKMSKDCRHEGFMVYGYNSSTALKLKSPYYLTQKLFARMGENKLDGVLTNPNSVKAKIDEEFYPLISHISNNKEEFSRLSEQERLAFMRNFING